MPPAHVIVIPAKAGIQDPAAGAWYAVDHSPGLAEPN